MAGHFAPYCPVQFLGSISLFELFYRTYLPNKIPEEPYLIFILILS